MSEQPAVGTSVTHPDREYTAEEREHLAAGPQPVPQVSSGGKQTVVAAEVTHPDRPLTPEERQHLGLPPDDSADEENDR